MKRLFQNKLATAWLCPLTVVACLALSQPSAQASITLNVVPGYTSPVETAASGTGFIVRYVDTQPAGTGNIDPFVRIQANTTEQGFNTSIGSPLDDKAGTWTHALQFGSIPLVTINGVSYREFLLDVNQDGNGPLSLNQVQIFTSTFDLGGGSFSLSAATSSSNALINFGAQAVSVFQMSALSTSSTRSYEVIAPSGQGSGTGNMYLDIPNSAFGVLDAAAYITLYSQFGTPPGSLVSNDGFEEWTLQGTGGGGNPPPVGAVPEPTSIAVWGIVSALAAGGAAWRKPKRGRSGRWSEKNRTAIYNVVSGKTSV